MNDVPGSGPAGHSVPSRTGTCPHCHLPYAGNITVCRACRAVHHTRCWRRHGGCGVAGCSRQGAGSVGWSRWPRKSVLVAAGVTAALLALGMFFADDGADGIIDTATPLAVGALHQVALPTTTDTTPLAKVAGATTTAPRTTPTTPPLVAFVSPPPAVPVIPPAGTPAGPGTLAVTGTDPATTTPPVARHDLAGTLFVDSYVDLSLVPACGGKGEFSGFQTGAEVAVTDGTGQVLATGTLGGCRWMEGQGCAECPGDAAFERAKPLFDFEVPELPEAPTYVFRVNWKAWPPISLSDLQATVWTVDLTVG